MMASRLDRLWHVVEKDRSAMGSHKVALPRFDHGYAALRWQHNRATRAISGALTSTRRSRRGEGSQGVPPGLHPLFTLEEVGAQVSLTGIRQDDHDQFICVLGPRGHSQGTCHGGT